MRADVQVAVVGGGVVGVAVAHALARRGVDAVLLEAEDDLATQASGTNSGILHTGFDSTPGELETDLILRSATLRDGLLAGLEVPVLRCGARLAPRDGDEASRVQALAAGAARNGVEATLAPDGALVIPGEAVTDPVAYVLALAGAAMAGGVEMRLRARVDAVERTEDGLVVRTAGGEALRCRVAVNAAGVRADEVARLAGDDTFAIRPRKGEFLVFEAALDQILLPVPTPSTKGVLVFPTVDGHVIAGPTAHDQDDREDWSVRPDARATLLDRARGLLPELEGREPVFAYAGLRPAGVGVNYLIGSSPTCERLVNVAAIRSTGLSASLGIAEHVCKALATLGVELGPDSRLPRGEPTSADRPWWRRSADRRTGLAA